MLEIGPHVSSPGVFRLPGTVIPTYYNLTLEPDIKKFSFVGHVDIKVDIKQSLNIITLHSKELDIYNIKLTRKSDKEHVYFETNDVKYDTERALVNLEFDTTVIAGNEFRLSIDFKGNINTRESYGLYYSNLTDAFGLTQHLLSTHFEFNHARRAFPCWDEPGYKAKFDVALLVPKDLTALSNTKVKQLIKHQNNWQYRFETTPIMSTYNLAYAVGDLEYVEATALGYRRVEPIRCRVYTFRGFSNHTRIALDATIKSLGFFEEYFGIPYTLDKIDLIAVPSHDALAMENWGLVTVKHSEMVLEDADNEKARNTAIFIIAHEISHQWFGNLVTPKTWDDLWLNEAFATYFGNLASEILYPEYDSKHFLNEFYIRHLKFLDEDDLSPILLNEIEPEEYSHQNLLTVYGKGAVMLDVLSQVIFKTKFQEFYRIYLKKFEFRSVESQDVYQMLSNLPGLNSNQFVDTWIKSKNYPYLTVTEDNIDDNFIKLTITQNSRIKETTEPLWYIPIDIVVENQISNSIVLSNKSYSVILPKGYEFKFTPAGFGYIKVNYNVSYDSQFYQSITDPCSTIFDDHDRTELISSTIDFFNADITNSDAVIDLILGFSYSFDEEIISSLINSINNFVQTWSNLPEFVSFFSPIKNQLYSQLNFDIDWLSELDPDNNVHKAHQQALLNSALDGNPTTIERANVVFQQFINGDISVVSPSMRHILFKIVLSQDSLYNLFSLLLMIDTKYAKKHEGLGHDIITSLGYCHPYYFEAVLSWAKSKKSGVLAWMLNYLRPDQNYGQIAWYFLKEHWSELEELDVDTLEFIVSSAAYNMMTPDLIQSAVTFLTPKDIPELKNTIVKLEAQRRIYQQNLPFVLARLNQIKKL